MKILQDSSEENHSDKIKEIIGTNKNYSITVSNGKIKKVEYDDSELKTSKKTEIETYLKGKNSNLK